MSAQATINHPFRHRILVEDASNLEATANKLGMMGNRTQALLSVLLNIFINEEAPDSEQVVAVLETAIGEAKDMQEVAFMLEVAAREQAKNAASAGGDQC
jgi:hypothetical protein